MRCGSHIVGGVDGASLLARSKMSKRLVLCLLRRMEYARPGRAGSSMPHECHQARTGVGAGKESLHCSTCTNAIGNRSSPSSGVRRFPWQLTRAQLAAEGSGSSTNQALWAAAVVLAVEEVRWWTGDTQRSGRDLRGHRSVGDLDPGPLLQLQSVGIRCLWSGASDKVSDNDSRLRPTQRDVPRHRAPSELR